MAFWLDRDFAVCRKEGVLVEEMICRLLSSVKPSM